jgi:hypothetical protein
MQDREVIKFWAKDCGFECVKLVNGANRAGFAP